MPTFPRTMDVDADEEYLRYLEELQRHPEYSPIHSSQELSQHPSDDVQSQSSDAHSVGGATIHHHLPATITFTLELRLTHHLRLHEALSVLYDSIPLIR
ncbi:hypothetical protein PIB30_074649 [Stylosanthes scabra]|uniref:Uncharacterized protein n=1 Tax=Stylosanthes scabra TaxID=79078 RepID=A0ABU6QPB1_9FABA|nr:hypothetical protein [Stylosanthes scabra]